jgi:hypothetical protein
VVQYSIGPIIILLGRITARKYVDRLSNQVHPMIKTLFSNNDVVFKDGNVAIDTAGTVQLWFEEHEGEVQHLPWPAQSPVFNIIDPLWSVSETRVRNRFLPPKSLKELKVVLQEEWYEILPETVQNLYESIPRRIAAILKGKGGPTPY